jgi:hypothetical protein
MATPDDQSMRRTGIVASVVLMSLLALSACYIGPDPIQYAALAMIDGKPTAVVASCGQTSFHVTIFRDDGGNHDVFTSWDVNVTPASPVRETEVELFGKARPGWEITADENRVGTQLKALADGHVYALDSSTGGPEGASAPRVKFSTDDLPTIGPAQVLAPVDHEHHKVVDRESFVKERCP